jgi:hypothetical protein
MLRDLTERGLGLVLGAAPDPFGGTHRVSRAAQPRESDECLVAAYQACYSTLVRYAAGKVGHYSARRTRGSGPSRSPQVSVVRSAGRAALCAGKF